MRNNRVCRVKNKMVEQTLLRGLNEFWSDYGGYRRGSLKIGGCYHIVGCWLGINTSGVARGLENQIYFSMAGFNNVQDDLEFASILLKANEAAVYLLLTVEMELNIYYNRFVSDMLEIDSVIKV